MNGVVLQLDLGGERSEREDNAMMKESRKGYQKWDYSEKRKVRGEKIRQGVKCKRDTPCLSILFGGVPDGAMHAPQSGTANTAD